MLKEIIVKDPLQNYVVKVFLDKAVINFPKIETCITIRVHNVNII